MHRSMSSRRSPRRTGLSLCVMPCVGLRVARAWSSCGPARRYVASCSSLLGGEQLVDGDAARRRLAACDRRARRAMLARCARSAPTEGLGRADPSSSRACRSSSGSCPSPGSGGLRHVRPVCAPGDASLTAASGRSWRGNQQVQVGVRRILAPRDRAINDGEADVRLGPQRAAQLGKQRQCSRTYRRSSSLTRPCGAPGARSGRCHRDGTTQRALVGTQLVGQIGESSTPTIELV